MDSRLQRWYDGFMPWYNTLLHDLKRAPHRLIWKTPKKKFTTFLQLGILHSAAVAIMFTAFSWTSAVEQLQLFEFTNKYLFTIPGNLWGVLLLIAVLGHFIEMVWRRSKAGPTAAMLGFMLWLYAAIAYIIIGSPTGVVLVAAFPLSFWTWYYFSSVYYHRQLDKGLIEPVD